MNRFVVSLLGSVVLGCSAGSPASPAPSDAGTTSPDTSVPPGDDGSTGAPEDGGASGDAGTAPQAVTFAYQPQWPGATKVEVVGGFGQASDWSKTASLVTLTNDGTGKFTGTASLPPGTYPYVFRVTGDAQAANAAGYERYAVDPSNTAFAPCPVQSPTYSTIDANPCSMLTVAAGGAPAPAAPVHVKGTVTVDGAGASGWMVVLEREEPKSHHFFANRVTTGASGAFDLAGSAGHYRLQVQHPTLLDETDLQRDPAQLAALRRAISSAFPLTTADVTVPTPDLAFHAYAQFAPTGDGGTLPTSFRFESGAEARLTVYGGPGDGGVVDIGDPWFAGGLTTDGGAGFDGAFNTQQSMQDAAAPGTRYMWGTEEPYGADAGVPWTKQTMVFPIVWQ